MSPERRLTIGAEAAELRRRLDPAAWVVLEELLLVSTGTGDTCTAAVSVRALAGRLGLSKDTIARALTRLRAAGLVTGYQLRADRGVFAAGSYLLNVPSSTTITDATPAAPESSSHSRRSRRSRPARDHDQLSLTLTT